MDFWRQLSLHSQVSFESIAICYNASFKLESKMVSKIFESYTDDEPDDEDDDESSTGYFLRTHLNRKQVSSGFWAYLIEEESREMKVLPSFSGNLKECCDSFMDETEELRKNQLYPHKCSDHCDLQPWQKVEPLNFPMTLIILIVTKILQVLSQ